MSQLVNRCGCEPASVVMSLKMVCGYIVEDGLWLCR